MEQPMICIKCLTASFPSLEYPINNSPRYGPFMWKNYLLFVFLCRKQSFFFSTVYCPDYMWLQGFYFRMHTIRIIPIRKQVHVDYKNDCVSNYFWREWKVDQLKTQRTKKGLLILYDFIVFILIYTYLFFPSCCPTIIFRFIIVSYTSHIIGGMKAIFFVCFLQIFLFGYQQSRLV